MKLLVFPLFTDHDDKHEAPTTQFPDSSSKKKILKQVDYTQPDALLDLGWFGNNTKYESDQFVQQDALGALFGDNCQHQP